MDLYEIRKKLSMGENLFQLPLRVTDYARVSTDHVEQKKSLQNQIEHFKQYITENKNWTYVEGYVDDGITGTSDIKRENFMQMIRDAKEKKFDLILTKEISRFSRNTLDSIKYTRELLSYGVAVFFVNDNINTALPDAELRLTIMASMAQDEVRRLSERVKFGMRRAMERGEILGNNRLFGYQKDKTTGKLEIIEEEAQLIREIYTLYTVELFSLSQIAKMLNQRLNTPNIGKKWYISTISRMISNPKYCGYYCARKTEIVDYMTKKVKYFDSSQWIMYEDKEKIPPIVSLSLWKKANRRLKARKKEKNSREKKETYQNRYLYSAKILCREHSCFFLRRVLKKSHEVFWACGKYLQEGKRSCTLPSIRERELETVFRDLFSLYSFDFSFVSSFLWKFYRDNWQEDDRKKEKLAKKRKREQLFKKKEKLLELSVFGNISNQEFSLRNEELNKQLLLLQQEEENLPKEDEKKENFSKIESRIMELLSSKEVFYHIIEVLLKRIEVSSLDNKAYDIQLDIFLSGKKEEFPPFFKKYSFPRGYETKYAKKYILNCEVSVYFEDEDTF